MVLLELGWLGGDLHQRWFELKCLWESLGFKECLVPNGMITRVGRQPEDGSVYAPQTEGTPYPISLN